jgi:hypothetical protein
MRTTWLTGTAVLLLAGCASGESGRTAAGKIDEAPPAQLGSAPPRAPHPHEQWDSIPAPYHGVFDGSIEACARPSDRRLTVSARALRFHESVGTVRSVGFGGSGAIAVEADYEGEGERWRNLRILSLSENGSRLTIKGDGDSLDRIRCPQGTR